MNSQDGDNQSVSPAKHPKPRHIAIIMDGNNRWAKKTKSDDSSFLGRGLAGHRAGATAAREIVQACVEREIEVLTLFAFSSENWARPRKEVKALMALFVSVLQKDEVKRLHEHNIRVRFIGNRDRFSVRLQRLMQEAENKTSENTGLTVVVAADYGGRWDICEAAINVAKLLESKKVKAEDINEELLASYMSLSDLPAPDLCIRTGGEQRISNFLLWQFAYTELYFTRTFWPDFDADELDKALEDFATRQRRYGLISEQVEQA